MADDDGIFMVIVYGKIVYGTVYHILSSYTILYAIAFLSYSLILLLSSDDSKSGICTYTNQVHIITAEIMVADKCFFVL